MLCIFVFFFKVEYEGNSMKNFIQFEKTDTKTKEMMERTTKQINILIGNRILDKNWIQNIFENSIFQSIYGFRYMNIQQYFYFELYRILTKESRLRKKQICNFPRNFCFFMS